MTRELLVMAMTRMHSGICTAGYVNEPADKSGLRWVRPVKEFGSLLLGDMSDAGGRVVEIGDVVALNLQQPRPIKTHVEDWITDFVHQRPRLLRRLTGEKRALFLEEHVDRDPADIMEREVRSLCLVQPEGTRACFSCDPYSGKYEVRLTFSLPGLHPGEHDAGKGLSVTDLKWRALGRKLLAEMKADSLSLTEERLRERLALQAIYLVIGLSRPYHGRCWPLIVGVHTVPDYAVTIDYNNL